MKEELLRTIPKMDALLSREEFFDIPRALCARAARECVDELRRAILAEEVTALPTAQELCARIRARAAALNAPHLRRVINATGTVLHTNLGRAPLGDALADAVSAVCRGYCNLEYDLANGTRGSRYSHVEPLICELTGAEAAMVVNNNAAAVFLMLAELAAGKGVAISRGELVEIGGAFRVPEIMEQSGCTLIEVGTTNKTRIADYRRAVEERGAGILLKVHTSNFKILGFTEETPLCELVSLGAEKDIPVLYDIGACFMLPPSQLGLHLGNTAREAVSSGADVVCFSGDKLLGASQAGIIAGKKKYIDAMRKNPITRMVRPDKLTLAALEAALSFYRDAGEAMEKLPAMAMLAAKSETLRAVAEQWHRTLCGACPAWQFTVRSVDEETGGGSLPEEKLSGWAVGVTAPNLSPDAMESHLRGWETPIIARIHEGEVLLSVRTTTQDERSIITDALRAAAQKAGE
ncbi:MAG: L-seryl-tRNA(Sec) selenium transferase [Oscillospiraceae bacterium]|nr:L-seryl-tRNA(Sec) selenium transferase [Oscillospiraceae bacterium]